MKISLAECSGIKPVTGVIHFMIFFVIFIVFISLTSSSSHFCPLSFPEKKYPFAFEIDLGKKKLIFACDQPDERESWIHHLRRFALLHGRD